jgi:hypothetical protein
MRVRGTVLLFCVILAVSLVAGCSAGLTAVKPNPEIDGSGSYRASFGDVEVTLDLPARATRDVLWIGDYIGQTVGNIAGSIQPAYTIASFTVRNASSAAIDCSGFSFVLHFKYRQWTSSETVAQFVKKFGVNQPLEANPWLKISNGTEQVSPHTSGISYRIFNLIELLKIQSVTVTYRGRGGGTKEMNKL